MKFFHTSLVIISFILLFSCTSRPIPTQRQIIIRSHKVYDSTRNAEAREDSIEMAVALTENAMIKNIVWATAETDPVESLEGEDAADDPAIWVNPIAPEKSLVLGTQKKAGLYTYDLTGKTKQFIPAGHINNVDLRRGFKYKNKHVALVAGSNRSINSISLFYIDEETAQLSDTISNIKSTVDEVYGICMYRSCIDQQFYVFVNGKGGKIEQWKVMNSDDKIEGQLIREFYVATQPEGMVANDSTGILYLGVEEAGIARLSAEPKGDTNMTWLAKSSDENPMIRYDIEGLDIYYGQQKSYLVASSQGNFSYAIWELKEPEIYVTSFSIWDLNIDGAEETDGLAISSTNLSPDYPSGLLVVQDGFNFDNDTLVNQNFKYVSWELIEKFLEK